MEISPASFDYSMQQRRIWSPPFCEHPADWPAGRAIIESMTPEFEMLKNDPDLEATPGPGRTLIFIDGDQYCVVGPEFVSTEESDCYAFGATREEAVANYAMKCGK
ncbi:MAG: hypothetical protein AB7J13_14130 [Pyrinomonadaceae bacterium]